MSNGNLDQFNDFRMIQIVIFEKNDQGCLRYIKIEFKINFINFPKFFPTWHSGIARLALQSREAWGARLSRKSGKTLFARKTRHAGGSEMDYLREFLFYNNLKIFSILNS